MAESLAESSTINGLLPENPGINDPVDEDLFPHFNQSPHHVHCPREIPTRDPASGLNVILMLNSEIQPNVGVPH